MTPLDLYQDHVSRGLITNDPHQHAAVKALDDVYQALVSRPTQIKKVSFVTRLKSLAVTRDDKIPGSQGVYLHGPVGRGKSMVMDLFYDCLPDAIPRRRVHFHAFMLEVHTFLHSARQESKGASEGPDMALIRFAEKTAAKLRVLCFDEFHVVDVADAMILSRLFTALLDKGLVVIMTSNWQPDRLYEGGLQRDRFLPFIDLIKSRFAIACLEGPTDYRLRLLEDNGVYRWPLGEGTQNWADRLFTELSGGVPLESQILELRGRALTVERTARGVARFTFAELCERPTGAEDYLAIAAAFHTVFLEGVPKLRYDRRNEAKRLMILIDALYEAKTRLIVTADAPPEKLYYGSDHAFEFERTVSRLLEMQSNAWLEKTEALPARASSFF